MRLVHIEAMLMDNDEIISLGKTLGWKKEMADAIHEVSESLDAIKACEDCKFSPCEEHEL